MKTLIAACRVIFLFFRLHTTKHLVILCSDFRFFRGTWELYSRLEIDYPDEIKIPGGILWVVKRSEFMVLSIKTLFGRHKIEEVTLIAHGGGCGGYEEIEGVSFTDDAEEQTYYENQLRKAKLVVQEIIPSVQIRMIYAGLTADRKLIDYVEIH